MIEPAFPCTNSAAIPPVMPAIEAQITAQTGAL